MRKTDISKYTGESPLPSNNNNDNERGKTVLKMLWKAFVTVFMVFVSACIIVGISLGVYMYGLSKEPTGIDLEARALNLSSFIYCENPETGDFEITQSLYGSENRVWVDFNDIPDNMKNAMIAIEDKRFKEHHGVDWIRTSSAVFSLATGKSSYGGSTLTQQLIKNITDDDEVSLTRKLREIFKALNVEREYTKDQILEAYLNVVNYGNNCQGVQAASQLYFKKDISQCSLIECASIAGITQNPSLWNPLIYPENNKERRELVLEEMLDQKKITKDEYNQAMKDSETLEFVGYTYDDDEEDETVDVQSWYIDYLFTQVRDDLVVNYNLSKEAAEDKIYTEGFNIYCAVDLEAQELMEKEALNINRSYDPGLQIGMCMVDFKGRLLGTVGNADKKEANLLFSNSTHSVLQPASAIKPLFAYPYSIEEKNLHFSSVVDDSPLPAWYKNGKAGPTNWYEFYDGTMLVTRAIERSVNTIPAKLIDQIGSRNVYDKAVTLMGFEHLRETDAEITGALSIGGTEGGTTVLEMASAFAYMGNGGRYYKPYSYYYVTDSKDKTILDNRDLIPKQAYSKETAAIMNRLLRYNIVNSVSTTAYHASVDGWEIIGKTGTSNDNKDSWFCGLSPYSSLAIWNGFETPASITRTGRDVAAKTFKTVMEQYLNDKKKIGYNLPDTVLEKEYCTSTGLLASSGCPTSTGYYTEDNMPSYCSSGHGGGSSSGSGSGSSSGSGGGGGSGGETESTTSSGGSGSEETTPSGGQSGGEETPTSGGGDTPTSPPEQEDPRVDKD